MITGETTIPNWAWSLIVIVSIGISKESCKTGKAIEKYKCTKSKIDLVEASIFYVEENRALKDSLRVVISNTSKAESDTLLNKGLNK